MIVPKNSFGQPLQPLPQREVPAKSSGPVDDFSAGNLCDTSTESAMAALASRTRLVKETGYLFLAHAAQAGALSILGVPGVPGAVVHFAGRDGKLFGRIGEGDKVQEFPAHSRNADEISTRLPDGRWLDLKSMSSWTMLRIEDKGTFDENRGARGSSLDARFTRNDEPPSEVSFRAYPKPDETLDIRWSKPGTVTLKREVYLPGGVTLRQTARPGQEEIQQYSSKGSDPTSAANPEEIRTARDSTLAILDRWHSPETSWQGGYLQGQP